MTETELKAVDRLRQTAFRFWLDVLNQRDDSLVNDINESFALIVPESWFTEWFQELMNDPLPENWQRLSVAEMGLDPELGLCIARRYVRWRRNLK